jgi:hypothetical protein
MAWRWCATTPMILEPLAWSVLIRVRMRLPDARSPERLAGQHDRRRSPQARGVASVKVRPSGAVRMASK